MKENVAILRQCQRDNRDARDEVVNKLPKDLFKLVQFRNVEARVYENNYLPIKEAEGKYLQKGTEHQRRLELTHERRAIRDEVEKKMIEARQISDNPLPSPRKAPVPKEDGVLQHRDTDFITSNRLNAQVMLAPERSKRDVLIPEIKHKAYGKNPKYLEDRKTQWQEEKTRTRENAPDPDCPRGMKLMPDEERLSTLESLMASKTEVLRLLGKNALF